MFSEDYSSLAEQCRPGEGKVPGFPSALSLWASAEETSCPPPSSLLPQPSLLSPTNLSRSIKMILLFSLRQLNSETTSGQYSLLSLLPLFSPSFRSSEFYLEEGDESQTNLNIDWSQLPEELSPQFGARKKKTNSSKVKLTAKKSNIDIQRTLTALEQRENSNKSGGDEKQDTQDDSEEEEKQSEHGSDADEPDEEMDGGTDYANNYFDNGEEYLDDEDDNLDEGGIY